MSMNKNKISKYKIIISLIIAMMICETTLLKTGSKTYAIDGNDYRLPVITSQPSNQSAQYGQNVTFSISARTEYDEGPLLYQWQKKSLVPNATWTNINSTSPILNVTATNATEGMYRCEVSNNGMDPVLSDGAFLSVNNSQTCIVEYRTDYGTPPVITMQPSNQDIVAGNITNFTMAAQSTSGGTLSYQWQIKTPFLKNTWTNIPNATSPTLSVAGGRSTAGYYRCIVTDSSYFGSAATTDTVFLTVTETQNIEVEYNNVGDGLLPTIISQPMSQIVPYAENIVMSVTAVANTPTGNISYQWQYKNINEMSTWTDCSGEGSNSSSFTIRASEETTGKYRCLVSDSIYPEESVMSDAAVLGLNTDVSAIVIYESPIAFVNDTGKYILKNFGTLNFIDGNVVGTTKSGIYNEGRLNINGGKIESPIIGIYNGGYDDSYGDVIAVNIDGNALIRGAYGIFTKAGRINVLRGIVVGTLGSGIYIENGFTSVTIGDENDSLSLTNPDISGATYGIENPADGWIKFYNGIIRGVIAPIFLNDYDYWSPIDPREGHLPEYGENNGIFTMTLRLDEWGGK